MDKIFFLIWIFKYVAMLVNTPVFISAKLIEVIMSATDFLVSYDNWYKNRNLRTIWPWATCRDNLKIWIF